jgi:hypothetical protein
VVNLQNIDYSKGGAPRRSFVQRLRGAMLLDATVFEEVEHDVSALPQAVAVVALAALAGGIGGFSQVGFIGGLVQGFIVWGLGAAIVWVIGVRVLGHTSDYPELLRTLGFGLAPQILFVIGAIPLGPLTGLLMLVVAVMAIVAWVIAVRQALDISTGRAVAICLLAHVVSMVLFVLIPGLA